MHPGRRSRPGGPRDAGPAGGERVRRVALADARGRAPAGAFPSLGELAERAGHARPSMSLDVYSHVMPTDEITAETFLPLLAE